MPDDAVIPDPRDAAKEAGLIYVNDDMPGITRQRSGKGFSYRGPDGKTITDKAERARLASLAIPPAYTDVWICPDPRGHVQATGRDAKGRKQYRYHPDFRAIRDGAKYDHMLDFAHVLPQIRDRVDQDMSRRGLPAEKVVATVVHLLENTMIRVGNADYARQNKSHGLTTLRDRHVKIDGSQIRFRFKGKSGKEWNLGLKDRRVARIVRAAQDIPGQHLFQYLDEDGQRQKITSTEVNAYLRDISGRNVTAKDFRTWTGTVLAALALAEYEAVDSQAAAKRNIREAIEQVAARLGNTPTICRKCYVHPQVIDSYLADELKLELQDEIAEDLQKTGLRPEERQVLEFLKKRLKT
ncbi:Eukaryotic DNA topoisomerase I, catalytic core [Paracoccus haematequi]|uniref:DNA topoisomerase n=1 Tax=Paracoccus haematequi TaxID=2491866 RepID=A0A3S4CYA1_9RHOB|nr:DNA topoisomerase IB [Paracoccus haematequi]VDS08359.1 Eukaryotic DNA topoisomerase I, catalytic core [Paracoccus haematequi]